MEGIVGAEVAVKVGGGGGCGCGRKLAVLHKGELVHHLPLRLFPPPLARTPKSPSTLLPCDARPTPLRLTSFVESTGQPFDGDHSNVHDL